LIKHEIYNKDYYAIDKINNFLKYIKSNYKIDPTKTLEEIIVEALHFNKIDSPLKKYVKSPISKLNITMTIITN